MRTVSLRLPQEYVDRLTAYGEGNLSAGVRRLVERMLSGGSDT